MAVQPISSERLTRWIALTRSAQASASPAGETSGVRSWHLWIGYLLAITAAELTVSLVSAEVGMGLHLALLFALPIHASFAETRQQPLLLPLLFAPLVRVVSLALPLAGLPIQSWWLLTSVPLFVSAVAAIRILGFSRQQLGLRVDRVPRQLAIGLIGVPLAAIEYYILHPAPIIGELSWETLLVPVLVLVVSTGFLEELLFRGIMQAAAAPLLGRWGLVYVSALFAALHIGYRSVPDVVFVFAVGLGFAWIVAWTGSLLGVTLAHGLTNIGLFIVFPVLAAQGLLPMVEPRDSRDFSVESVASSERSVQLRVVVPTASDPPESRPAAAVARSASATFGIGSSPTVAPPAVTVVPQLPETAAAQSSLAGTQTRVAVAPATEPTASKPPAVSAPANAPPTSSTSPVRVEQYVVQPGDTLTGIAALRGTTVDALVALNGIPDQDHVLAGQALIVATGETSTWGPYTVQPGDTVASIAQRTGTTVETLTQVNRLDDRDWIIIGQQLLVPRR